MSPRRRKLIRRITIAGGAFVLTLALLLGAFQFVFSRVPEYRVQLQDWLSERTGLAIEFSRLSARLRKYGPELVFRDAIVRSPDRTIVLATARRGSVGFDLWTSLRTGRLTAGRFSLTSPEIGLIRTREGGIQLVGQYALPDRDTSKPFPIEKLPVGEFWVTNAVVSFRDEATGRGPWALSGVSFSLDRRPGALELAGNAVLPAALGESLTFTATAQGALEQSAALVTKFSVEGKLLDLAGWADVLPDEWPAPETGHGSLRVTGTMLGTQLTRVATQVDFSNVAAVAPVWTIALPGADPLVAKPDETDASGSPAVAVVEASKSEPETALEPPAPAVADMLSYSRIAFAIEANRVGEGWKVSASDVAVARAKDVWRSAALSAQWSTNEAGGMTLEAKADHLALQSLWPLLGYLPESERLAQVRALRATGDIDNLTLNFQRGNAQEAPRYSLQADIRSAGISPVERAPGISSLTGRVQATHEGGQLLLNSTAVRFELPRMFRGPLDIQSVRGAIDWRREAAGLRLTSNDMRIETVDGNAVATLALMLPADGSSPLLEMKAQAQGLNAAATPKYLPADKLSPKTLDWLDRAFVTGRVAEAEVSYRGPMRSFPFRRGEGEFLVRGRVEGIEFNYQDGWTPATQLAAQVEFRNQGMRVRGGTAVLGDLRLANIAGEFADFRAGNIAVDAVASGDLDHALNFLQASPVSAALGETFQQLGGQGETESRVTLWLPMKRIADRRIAVASQLRDATVTLEGVDAPITNLTGTFNVKQSLPESAHLQGQWLGGPLSVTIEPEAAANRSVLTAKVQASADKLAALLHLPASVKIDGAANWRVRVPLAAGAGSRLAEKFVIDSTLNGMGADMPHPIGKPQAEVRPLHVELEYSGEEAMLARASLGDVRALLRMQHSPGGWSLDRGGVRADAIAAALPDHRGIRIEGSVDELTLDDWFALRDQRSGAGEGDGSKLSDVLHAVNLRVGMLRVFGFQFAEVRGIMQAVSSGWKIDVSGPNAAGSMQIPENFTGTQPLSASLERLIVTSDTDTERKPGKKSPSDPRTWPALRLFVANLKVDTHAIGTVDLRASRIVNGVQIDALTLVQDAAQGEATGQWLMTAEGERATLKAKLSSTDVGATLRGLNYTQFMEAKLGEISADLAWQGGFDGHFLGKASGTLTVKADNGQLLNVKPGAGRVLGLMSVGALPRRLALDFSDLIEKGLSFDSVHGDFELRNGDAFTTNLLLRGPAAEIGIAGRTGLGAHDYDQTAVVTGNLGATLPVAGALAGGPVVGAALLVFSRVFKEPLKGIVRGYYRISGSWDEPVVERVDAAGVREAAATETG